MNAETETSRHVSDAANPTTQTEHKGPEFLTLTLAEIKRDTELACRAKGVNKVTVREYSAAMLAGSTFPPIVVFRDGKGSLWLADGFHRCGAAELAERAEMEAEVRQGGRKEALLFAAQANAANGLRRSSADKRRAVELVLKAFPKWSARKVAEATGVDHKTVVRVRDAEPAGGEIPQPAGRNGGDEEAPSEEVLLRKLDETERWLRARAESGAGFALAADEIARLVAALRPPQPAPTESAAPRKSKRRPAEASDVGG